MAPSRARIAVQSTAPVSHRQRISTSDRTVIKTLSRLTRTDILKVVQIWLEEAHVSSCQPVLRAEKRRDEDDDEDDLFSRAGSVEELREVYAELQARNGGKREVLDRALEGDWRHGVTHYQLAIADCHYTLEHTNSQKWTAFDLVRVEDVRRSENEGTLPRFHVASFLTNLQREIGSLIKAHFYVTRAKDMPISLLRIHICDTPYGSRHHHIDHLAGRRPVNEASSTIYVVFPDATPVLYVSSAAIIRQAVPTSGKDSRRIVVESLPKALSRPHSRYTLSPSRLSTKSLSTLLALRGPGRTNAASGGWMIYANDTADSKPLDPIPLSIKRHAESDKENGQVLRDQNKQPSQTYKRRKLVEGRFGPSAHEDDGVGIEQFAVTMHDPLDGPSGTSRFTPNIHLSFQGKHVFAGIRQLAEQGFIDTERMPGWMTGEAGVSGGKVRDGRITNNEGHD